MPRYVRVEVTVDVDMEDIPEPTSYDILKRAAISKVKDVISKYTNLILVMGPRPIKIIEIRDLED